MLPFVNASGDPDTDYLSDGMTESLINALARLPGLSVKARSMVFRYKGKEVEPLEVASALSVQSVVNGRMEQHGDKLTLSLALVNGRNGNQIWASATKARCPTWSRCKTMSPGTSPKNAGRPVGRGRAESDEGVHNEWRGLSAIPQRP